MTTAAKQLLELSRRLPPEKVREVVDFAEFLVARSSGKKGNGSKGGKSLRRYIGGVKHGALASNIDDELYGRTVR